MYNEPENICHEEQLIPLFAEERAELAQRNAKQLFKGMTQYKCAMMDIESRFNLLNEEYILEHDRAPINSIKTRLKSLPSIVEKLRRKGYPLSAETISTRLNDVAGVRVICAFTSDVYELADALLRQDDIELIEKKDYIANPKENGYRSLHLIVTTPIYLSNEKKHIKVEIQLRTIAMDSWASLEHRLRYKSNAVFTEEMTSELQYCAMLSQELDCRMDALKKEIL